ncbi:hypothetical protein SEA_GODONK_100 [Gordonia phage GodonK]|uniref:Uncharacterized protein n=1 Tax=Gordonia phage GodonK TaxID=2562192 RepID=A0A4D6E226_9CAUD|nr:hypothetical protein HOV33_gp100 [Gordonia phage GodonK]QBZ72719.1 hypothetical protein SEA_GODONK_100 [Gordonia phage GodonK]
MRTPWSDYVDRRDGLSKHDRHFRKVSSGSYPYYRLSALLLVLSALIQFHKVPASVEQIMPEYFYYVNPALQLLAGVLIAAGLYYRRDIIGLYIERSGVVFGATSMLVYNWIVFKYQGFPSAPGVWLTIAFGLYCVYRFFESTRDIRNLERIAEQIKAEKEA